MKDWLGGKLRSFGPTTIVFWHQKPILFQKIKTGRQVKNQHFGEKAGGKKARY